MWKHGKQMILVIVAAMLVQCVCAGAVEKPEFSREQEFYTKDGAFVVQSGSARMYIVSASNRTIQIKSSNSSSISCKLAIDPFEEAIVGEVRAKLLLDSRKMLIWGVHGWESDPANDARTIFYSMLLIDLDRCESESLRLPDEQLVLSQPLSLPQIVLLKDGNEGFDVHYASHWACSPCSFDWQGSRRSRDNGPLEAEDALPAGPIHLHWLYPNKDSLYYFYAFNFADNRSAVVKLLDYEYRARKLKYLEHPIEVVSAKTGKIRNVGYCYRELDSLDKLHCERLDSRLQSVVSVLVPLDQPAHQFSFDYDEQGNFFVGVLLSAELRVFVYDLFGQLLASFDFGQVQDTQRVRNLQAYFQDNDYCLFYSIDLADSRVNNVVKCIYTPIYIPNPVEINA